MLAGFLIIYITIVLYISYKKRGTTIINDSFWLVISWVLLFGLYFTSGIEYDFSLQLNTILYLLLVLSVFLVTRKLGLRTTIQKYAREKSDLKTQEQRIDTKPYYYLAFIGLSLRAFDLMRLNDLTFGTKIDLGSSFIGVIGSFFTPLGLLVWLYEVIWAIRTNRLPPMRAYIAIAIFTLPVILISGRVNLIIIFLASFIAIIYSLKTTRQEASRKREHYRSNLGKFIKPLAVCAVLFFINYSIFLASNRYGTNLALQFEYSASCSISEETLSFTNRFGALRDVILNGLYYYSHQLSTIQIIFQYYDGPYLLGMHQLHYVSRRLPDFLYLDSSLADYSFGYIASSLGAAGFSSAWKTAVGSFIFDFGKIGSVIFVGFIGFCVGQKRKKFLNNQTVYETVFQTLICVGMFFSIQYSPFYETSWAYAFYWLLIIPVVEGRDSLRKRRGKFGIKTMKRRFDHDAKDIDNSRRF